MVFVRDGVYIKTTNCDPGQVFEAWQTGMDCMLIPMHIIRTLHAQDPDLPFCVVANGIKDDEGNEIPFVGEDNFFAHRVRKAGFNFLTTTDVQCLHVDMDTGKYTAHPSVNLDHYYCNVKLIEPLTLADKARLERRWHERLPKKMESVPSAIGLGNLLSEDAEMVGLEIGTEDGTSTEFLLNKFSKLKLFGVDPYDSYRDWDSVQMLKQHRQKTFEKFLIKMQKYGSRYTHIPATSDQAVEDFKNESLDFIFIDGDHSYEQVAKDLRNYYSKVKLGGVFSGHDYRVLPGVKRAVDEFAAEIGKEVLYTERDVWYWVK
jgi:predicted O-methyltransferase YrrM